MKHIRSGALKILTLAMFFVPLFYSVSLAGSNMVEQLPPEYENIQGVLIAWLPYGPVPNKPLSAMSAEEITRLNEKSTIAEQGRNRKYSDAINKNMAEQIKLIKDKTRSGNDGPGPEVYPYHYMMLDLVKAIIESGVMAHIVTDDPSICSQIVDFMIACGFKSHELKKIRFHCFWLDSIWIRDYGPWVTRVNDRLAVIDNEYYFEREADNIFPEFFAGIYNLPRTDFDEISSEGGNILTDGQDTGFSTEAVLNENPGIERDDIIELFKDVLNLDEFVFLPGSFNDNIPGIFAALGATGHVDMGLKLLSDSKVMIGDFEGDSPGKELLDSWAQWFYNHTNPKGKPYEVFRVTGKTNGIEPYSYINSVIINKTIIVPQFGDAARDKEAIKVYKNAMPGYKTIGVRSELLTLWSGGLHCITREIPEGILKESIDEVAL